MDKLYFNIKHKNGERLDTFRCIAETESEAINKMMDYYNRVSFNIKEIKSKLFDSLDGSNAFMEKIAEAQRKVIADKKAVRFAILEKRKAKALLLKKYYEDLKQDK